MTEAPERSKEPSSEGAPQGVARRAVLFAAATVAVYFVAELFVLGEPTFPLDDPWIHLQFARNLAAGEGMSYQEGRQVAGSTAPLWTLLLAPAAPWTGIGPLWAKLLGIAFHLAGVAALVAVCRCWRLSRFTSTLAAVFMATSPWLLWSALSGMEIPLFVLLCLLGTRAHMLDLEPGVADPAALPAATIWLALAALARPEGLLLLALSWLDRALELRRSPGEEARLGLRRGSAVDRRVLLRHGVAAASILGPVALYNALISGSVFPTTLGVKTEAATRVLPRLRDLWEMGLVVFPELPWLTLLLGAGLALNVASRPARSLLPSLWVVALPCAFSLLGGEVHRMNHGRYLFPLLPFVILVGALAIDVGVAQLPRRARVGGLAVSLRLLLGVILLAPTVASARGGLERYLTHSANVLDSDVAAARWVAENLPRDAVLAVQDIGAMAYYAPQRLVDMVGIVNPEILPYLRGELRGSHPSGLGGWADFLRQEGVDFLVVFPSSFRGGLQALGEVMPGARVVHAFEIQDNVAMIGSELVVVATPWSMQ